MILTGKAKEDFEKWYSKGVTDKEELYNIFDFFENKECDTCKNALIIDWFDSIDRINFQELYMNEFRDNYLMYPILSIQAETIKKANEIYNKICPCCNGKGLVEGEEYDDVQSCLTCNGSGKLC